LKVVSSDARELASFKELYFTHYPPANRLLRSLAVSTELLLTTKDELEPVAPDRVIKGQFGQNATSVSGKRRSQSGKRSSSC